MPLAGYKKIKSTDLVEFIFLCSIVFYCGRPVDEKFDYLTPPYLIIISKMPSNPVTQKCLGHTSGRPVTLAVLALLVTWQLSSCVADSSPKPTGIASALATPAQLFTDSLSIQIKDDTAIQNEEIGICKSFLADTTGKTADGDSVLKDDIHQLAFGAIEEAIAEDLQDPQFIWINHSPRKWNGLDVPGSKFALDNPDNVYRVVYLDSTSRYEIHIHHLEKPPIQESFELFNGEQIAAPVEKHLGFVQVKDLKAEPNGDYILTAGPEVDSTNPNHLQISKPLVSILYRSTYSVWAEQTPPSLEVKQLSGPVRPAPSRDRVVATALDKLKLFSYYLVKIKKWFSSTPNILGKPKIREGGWGFGLLGQFNLTKNQAWIVSVNPKGAKYLSFQLGDPWLVSADYIDHTGGLNNTQVKTGTDGICTYVISAADPGVNNWLNTGGLTNGSLFIRWQVLPDSIKAIDDAIVSQKVVKLTDISSDSSLNYQKLTAQERANMLTARSNAYHRRTN
jgi:hypothetical protein